MPPEAVARQVRVTRGADVLSTDEPRWPWGAIDPGRIVIGDHRWGVPGQVYARQAGSRGDPHRLGLERLGIPPAEAADYGFEPLSDEDRDELGLIWAGLVQSLREEAQSFPPLPLLL